MSAYSVICQRAASILAAYADDQAVPIGIRTLSALVLDYLASGAR